MMTQSKRVAAVTHDGESNTVFEFEILAATETKTEISDQESREATSKFSAIYKFINIYIQSGYTRSINEDGHINKAVYLGSGRHLEF